MAGELLHLFSLSAIDGDELQLYAHTSFPPIRNSLVPVELEAVWAPQTVWMFWTTLKEIYVLRHTVCWRVLYGSEDKRRFVTGITVTDWLLGAFSKLRNVTISFIMSVRPSACNNSAPTGRIFIKFDIRIFLEKTVYKIQVSLKSHNNNRYFTCRPIYIFDHISLSSA